MNTAHPKLNTNSIWLKDFKAGFVVFLIALPLCVGIAAASDAPPASGLIAAIVGGILGTFIKGTHVTITGPAAGLIVIVLGAIHGLGGDDLYLGYRLALAAFVGAGLLQILLGLIRAGSAGLAVPTSVVHGMMMAIGFIIVVKQIPVLMGVAPNAHGILGIATEIPSLMLKANPEITLIGAVSLLILTNFTGDKFRIAKQIPAPMLVIVAGYFLASQFNLEHPHTVQFSQFNSVLGPQFLLDVPQELSKIFVFPDFSKFFTWTSIQYSISLCLVGSIESILSANAVDKIDPEKRKSDFNRELFSKGACNIVSGLVGGLPVISEIVRSTANVQQGAVSLRSNFFHGVFLLLFLALCPAVLHGIPLSALAGVLIVVGLRLANVDQVAHAMKIGKEHLASFLVTLIVTLTTDLLIGVCAGIATELLYAFAQGVSLKQIFRPTIHRVEEDTRATLHVKTPLIFLHALSLERSLMAVQHFKEIRVDFEDAKFIDHTILSMIDSFASLGKAEGRNLDVRFSNGHVPKSKHRLAARKLAHNT